MTWGRCRDIAFHDETAGGGRFIGADIGLDAVPLKDSEEKDDYGMISEGSHFTA